MANREGNKAVKYLVTQVNPAGDEIGYVSTLYAARLVNLKREIIRKFNLVSFITQYNPDLNVADFKKWLAIPEEAYTSAESKKYASIESALGDEHFEIANDNFYSTPFVSKRLIITVLGDDSGDNDLFFVADKMRDEKEVKRIMKKRA